MVQFTPADLRRITDEAIASAKLELAGRKDAIFRAAMQQLKVDVTAGRNYSVAMSLKAGDDYETGSVSRQSLRPNQLIGVAALLFAECAAFSPEIQYWSKVESDYRESYTVSGFNIVLHWTTVEDLLSKLATIDDTTARAIRAGIEAAQAAVADKAAGILAQLKNKATAQAKAGKNWALVMSLKNGDDFTCPSGKRITQIEPTWLGPVARAVWDACSTFAPTLEYWSKQESDMRNETWTVEGVNIVVHW